MKNSVVISSRDELASINSIESDGLGTHVLADFYGCSRMPQTSAELQAVMLRAAEEIEATVVAVTFHEFSPHGLSGVVVIAESHLAIHTWPENGIACIDLFTCSPKMDARPGLGHLFDVFGASKMKLTVAGRANVDPQ